MSIHQIRMSLIFLGLMLVGQLTCQVPGISLKLKNPAKDLFILKPEYLKDASYSQSLLTYNDRSFNVTLDYERKSLELQIERTGANLGSNSVQVLSFQSKMLTSDSVLFFLCYKDPKITYSNGCCVISMIISEESQFYDCQTDPQTNLCLIKVLVKENQISGNNDIKVNFSASLARGKCEFDFNSKPKTLHFLPPIFVKKPTKRDQMLSFGDDILLEHANKELMVDEDFTVTIYIVETSKLTEINLKCEIPEQTYIEFQNATSIFCHTRSFNSTTLQSCSPLQQWHVEVNKPNRNSLLEFKARRIQQKVSEIAENKKYGIFQITFKVLRVLSQGNAGFQRGGKLERKIPRLLWSLGPNSVPQVMRLVVKSSTVKKILMQMKEKVLIHFSPLVISDNTTFLDLSPRVYGLTYENQVIDVTEKATCYSTKDSILLFENQSCFRPRLNPSADKTSRVENLEIVGKLNDLATNSYIKLVLHFEDSVELSVINNSGAYNHSDLEGKQFLVETFYKTPSQTFYPPVLLQAFFGFSFDTKPVHERSQLIAIDIQKFLNENLVYKLTAGTKTTGWISVNEPLSSDSKCRILILEHSQLSVFCSHSAEIAFKFIEVTRLLLTVKFLPPKIDDLEKITINSYVINSLLIQWDVKEHSANNGHGYEMKQALQKNSQTSFSYATVNFEICPTLKSNKLGSIFSQLVNYIPRMNNHCDSKFTDSKKKKATMNLDFADDNKDYYLIQLSVLTGKGSVETSLEEIFQSFKKVQLESPFKVLIVNHIPDLMEIHLPEAFSQWFVVRGPNMVPERLKMNRKRRRLLKRSPDSKHLHIKKFNTRIAMPALKVKTSDQSYSGKIMDISLIPKNPRSSPHDRQRISTLIFGNIIGTEKEGVKPNQPVNLEHVYQPRNDKTLFPGYNGSMNEDADTIKKDPEETPVKKQKDNMRIAGTSESKPGLPSNTKESRRISPLELGMYVLLGFSILIALVFSVNCGAIVAKYKWERMANRQRTNAKPPNGSSSGHSSLEKKGTQYQNSSLENHNKEKTGLNLMKRIGQQEEQNTLQKDPNFIWLQNHHGVHNISQTATPKIRLQHHQTPQTAHQVMTFDRHNALGNVYAMQGCKNGDDSGTTSDNEINFAFSGQNQTPMRNNRALTPTYDDPPIVVNRDGCPPPSQSAPPIPFESSTMRSNHVAPSAAICPQCNCPEGIWMAPTQYCYSNSMATDNNVDNFCCKECINTAPTVVNNNYYTPSIQCKMPHPSGVNSQIIYSVPYGAGAGTIRSMGGAEYREGESLFWTKKRLPPMNLPPQQCNECNTVTNREMTHPDYRRPPSMLTVDSDLSAWGHQLTRHFQPEEIRDYIENLKESNA